MNCLIKSFSFRVELKRLASGEFERCISSRSAVFFVALGSNVITFLEYP
jgi:hypothetical protein